MQVRFTERIKLTRKLAKLQKQLVAAEAAHESEPGADSVEAMADLRAAIARVQDDLDVRPPLSAWCPLDVSVGVASGARHVHASCTGLRPSAAWRAHSFTAFCGRDGMRPSTRCRGSLACTSMSPSARRLMPAAMSPPLSPPQYVMHFPKLEPYVSLLVDPSDPGDLARVRRERDRLRAAVRESLGSAAADGHRGAGTASKRKAAELSTDMPRAAVGVGRGVLAPGVAAAAQLDTSDGGRSSERDTASGGSSDSGGAMDAAAEPRGHSRDQDELFVGAVAPRTGARGMDADASSDTEAEDPFFDSAGGAASQLLPAGGWEPAPTDEAVRKGRSAPAAARRQPARSQGTQGRPVGHDRQAHSAHAPAAGQRAAHGAHRQPRRAQGAQGRAAQGDVKPRRPVPGAAGAGAQRAGVTKAVSGVDAAPKAGPLRTRAEGGRKRRKKQ